MFVFKQTRDRLNIGFPTLVGHLTNTSDMLLLKGAFKTL